MDDLLTPAVLSGRADGPLAAASARRRLTSALRADLRSGLALFLGTRVLIWGVALLALALFGTDTWISNGLDAPAYTHPFHAAWLNTAFAPLARWDSSWYLAIAHRGYFSPQSAAFFPALPLLLAGGGIVFGNSLIAGLLISLVCGVTATVLLLRLGRLDLSEREARLAVLLLLVFPTSLFLSAIYTESLFLALSLGCLLAARRQRWAWAGGLAAVATLTRSTGILLLLPLVLIAWEQRHEVPWRERLAWLAVVPSGLLAYMAYLSIAHHQPMAAFHAERFWAREFAGPFGAVWDAITALPGTVSDLASQHGLLYLAPDAFSWQTYQLIDLPFLVFAVVGVWLCWKRLPRAWSAYALVVLLESLSYPVADDPLKSFSRYVLVVFPLFLGWGSFLAGRPWSRRAYLTVSVLGTVGVSALWGTWNWVA